MSKLITTIPGQPIPFNTSDAAAPETVEPSIPFDLPDLTLEKSGTAVATVPSGNTTAFYRSGGNIGGIREGHYTDY